MKDGRAEKYLFFDSFQAKARLAQRVVARSPLRAIALSFKIVIAFAIALSSFGGEVIGLVFSRVIWRGCAT